MTIIQSIVLGVIQGITEFLPISSSGHLVFVPKIFGWGDQGIAFDVIVHLGSLLAVIVFFRQRLWNIFLAGCGKRKEGRGLGLLLLLSIIPAGIVGLLFGDIIENSLRATWVVGVGLIFWGLVLGVADFYSGKGKEERGKSIEKVNWKQTLFIGCAQAIALIPGTSRSGITMTAGLFSKLDKKSAAEFSFLMSVPIIALAGFLKIIDLVQVGLGDLNLTVLIVGFISAAVSGFIAIAGLMKIIQKWSFMPFVVYRVVVGIAILLFF